MLLRTRTLRGKVLCQVGDDVALALQIGRCERDARGGRRIDAVGVVHKIAFKPGTFDLFGRKVFGQLVHDGADHFHVGQLFGADVSQQTLDIGVRRRKALVQIAQRCAQFAVRAPELLLVMTFMREK